jgi:hypothetical protein
MSGDLPVSSYGRLIGAKGGDLRQKGVCESVQNDEENPVSEGVFLIFF